MANILITGASSGIGSALALQYATPDNSLILIARNHNRLRAIADRCEQSGATTRCISLDVTELEKTRQTLSDIDATSPIDLVIANAGVTSSIGNNGEPESWQAIKHVIDTNLYGVLATLEPLISAMRERQHGHIALVSSLAAYRGMPITPAYSASKAGIKAYGEALSGWLRHDNINVSIILPGFVKSDMSDDFPGNKPFLISTEKAARIIQVGLDKKRSTISFPFPLNIGTWLLGLLPTFLANRIFEWTSYGGRRP